MHFSVSLRSSLNKGPLDLCLELTTSLSGANAGSIYAVDLFVELSVWQLNL